ncbi:25353_t:CDS:1, partial [Gigaspora margarita]
TTYNNPEVATSIEQTTSIITNSDVPISTSTNKLSNQWTSPEIRILIEEVGSYQ